MVSLVVTPCQVREEGPVYLERGREGWMDGWRDGWMEGGREGGREGEGGREREMEKV